jgi:hypothetical protein
MNSYNTVYNNGKKAAKAETFALHENQRVELVNAIKREYGISDFSTLDEKERKACHKFISEMWSPETGLNEKGIDFINEGKRPLNKDSKSDKIKSEFMRCVKKDIDTYASSLVFGDSDVRQIKELKERIEKETERKLKLTTCREWIYEAMCNYIHRKINKLKF